MKKIIFILAMFTTTFSLFSFKGEEEKQFWSYQIKFTGEQILYLMPCKANKSDHPTPNGNIDPYLKKNVIDVVFKNGKLLSPELLYGTGFNISELKIMSNLDENSFNIIYNNFNKEELFDAYNSSPSVPLSEIAIREGIIIGIKSQDNEVGLYLFQKVEGDIIEIKACHY